MTAVTWRHLETVFRPGRNRGKNRGLEERKELFQITEIRETIWKMMNPASVSIERKKSPSRFRPEAS